MLVVVYCLINCYTLDMKTILLLSAILPITIFHYVQKTDFCERYDQGSIYPYHREIKRASRQSNYMAKTREAAFSAGICGAFSNPYVFRPYDSGEVDSFGTEGI